MRLAKGASLGSYEVIAGIGAGGMGEVDRAVDTREHQSSNTRHLRPLRAFVVSCMAVSAYNGGARIAISATKPGESARATSNRR
jgi:hypothetical protein